MKFALYFQHIWHELFIYLQSFVISDFPLNPWDAVCFEEGNADVQIELKSLLLNPLLLTFPELCSLVHFSPVQSCAPHPCKPIRSNSCQAWDLDRTSIRASLSCVPATIPLCCCQPTPPVYCYLSFNQLSSCFFLFLICWNNFYPSYSELVSLYFADNTMCRLQDMSHVSKQSLSLVSHPRFSQNRLSSFDTSRENVMINHA